MAFYERRAIFAIIFSCEYSTIMSTSKQRSNPFRVLLSLVLATSDPASSTFIEYDPASQNNFSISINVPSNDESNDLFFSMSAPAGQGWIAFGFGKQMAGALIFLAYPSEDGTNITLSPRLGKGHVMPDYYPNVTVDLLSGSGFVNESYVVNAKCQNCRSWDGGSVDITSSKQPMIWALGSSSDDVKSNSQSATILEHYAKGQFDLDMVAATGVGGVPVANATSKTTVIDQGSGDHTLSSGLHALLMVGSFVVGFPLGAILLRVFEKVWLHWIVQSFTALVVILGAAAGIYISEKYDKV